MVRSTGYSFEPLQGLATNAYGPLAPGSFPSNFLIDKNGGIAFSKFIINQANEGMLERMIKDLLAN